LISLVEIDTTHNRISSSTGPRFRPWRISPPGGIILTITSITTSKFNSFVSAPGFAACRSHRVDSYWPFFRQDGIIAQVESLLLGSDGLPHHLAEMAVVIFPCRHAEELEAGMMLVAMIEI
jgi:hypothetical protein